MLRRAFIYVREVRADCVLVMLTDWAAPTELPRELFTPHQLKKLASVCKFTGYTSQTRHERNLVVSGPFLIIEDDK